MLWVREPSASVPAAPLARHPCHASPVFPGLLLGSVVSLTAEPFSELLMRREFLVELVVLVFVVISTLLLLQRVALVPAVVGG